MPSSGISRNAAMTPAMIPSGRGRNFLNIPTMTQKIKTRFN
jgi:hypothetical protein